jgi:hypothetical protein
VRAQELWKKPERARVAVEEEARKQPEASAGRTNGQIGVLELPEAHDESGGVIDGRA